MFAFIQNIDTSLEIKKILKNVILNRKVTTMSYFHLMENLGLYNVSIPIKFYQIRFINECAGKKERKVSFCEM